MKALLVTLVIGLIVCALAQSYTDVRRLNNPDFQVVNVTVADEYVLCAREWVGTPSAEDPTNAPLMPYRVTASSLSFCEVNGKPLRAAEFQAGAGSKPGPHFWSRTLVKQFRTSSTATIKGFEAYIAFDRFGTYSGTFNSATLDWYVELFSANTTLFTEITVTKNPINGDSAGNFLYTLSFNSLAGAFPAHPNLVLTFTLDVTPVVTRFGLKVLTPDSFKLTVDATGIDYLNSGTPGGVYLGAWLLTGKEIGTITRGNNTEDLDAPGVPSSTNGNLPILNNATDPDQGFFSFDLKSWGDNVTSKDVDVIYVRSATEDGTFFALSEFTEYVARRIHFATSVKSNTAEWDPSVGASDTALGGATSLIPSLSLLLFALIALLL
jgi:hypothetical protein